MACSDSTARTDQPLPRDFHSPESQPFALDDSLLARHAARSGDAGLAVDGAWSAHAGHGLIDLRLTGEPAALRAIVADLRAAAVAHGGSLVVTDAPPAIWHVVDPWGASPALAIMRRVKEQFDPHATLNPGRFVGGI